MEVNRKMICKRCNQEKGNKVMAINSLCYDCWDSEVKAVMVIAKDQIDEIFNPKPKKNIYLLTLKHMGYDEFDSWVVIADNEEEVLKLCDIREVEWTDEDLKKREKDRWRSVNNQFKENIESIKLIGTTNETESKIVLGSYNAG